MRLSILFSVMVWFLSIQPAFSSVLVSADWVKNNSGKIVILDVQNKKTAYGKGHIPNALQIIRHKQLENHYAYTPNKYPTSEQFQDLMRSLGISNEDTVVAYDDHHGIFASRLVFLMEYFGHEFSKLKILDGGIVEWKNKGYTITKKNTSKPARSNYETKSAMEGIIVSWSDIFHNVIQKADPDIVLIDTRPEKEFKGEKKRTTRSGHIPGAINITGQDAFNYDKSHKYLPLDKVAKSFKNIKKSAKIYLYCHSSDRAAHAYVGLVHLLGYKNVHIYDGAWLEWANLTALPIK